MTSTSDTLREATRAFEAGDHAAAVRLFEQMIVASPESAELYHNLGQAHRGAGNLASAADAFAALFFDDFCVCPMAGILVGISLI